MSMHRLTAVRVASAPNGAKLHDGAGLWLRVTQAGTARWVFRFTSPEGRRREMGLGAARGAGAVTLAAARALASDARAKLANGIDPLDAAETAKRANAEARAAEAAIPTFEQAASAYIDRQEGGWRNAKHRQQWRNTVGTYCGSISAKKVDRITTKDLVAVLTQPITDEGGDGSRSTLPLWLARRETASRLRGRIERILGAEIAAGHHPGPNPARWLDVLQPLLPAVPDEMKAVQHQRALAIEEVPAFVAALRGRQVEAVAALAAEFLILTAARTMEVLGATWGEINLDAAGGAEWTIPATRMKMKRPHTVPLTSRAVALLERCKDATGGRPDMPLFPSPRQRPNGAPAHLSQMSMLVLLRRMGWADRTTMHGMRSSFRDWAAEKTNFPREVCEAALAHVAGDKTEAAYLRTDHRAKRRKLMEAWHGWIERGIEAEAAGAASNVTPLRAAGGWGQ